eukprot:TRINITY_DN77073_c0_g1_i1.p1 TRINITY_DN77073_c0_g1~~TRINITY_DN77073_c0_g1_i1.p1  ORF type:complete len:142 (+),score=9.59 TRINITY_DN77073_c0_g1_i1:52-477(+)
MTIPPSQTLYCNNLNDRIPKEELKRSLYLLFSQYGPIMDIVCTKVPRMRGQGFIVFKDTHTATAAMRACSRINFLDKELRISYAKAKSDTVARADGSYSQKKKRERKEKQKEKERERERLKQKRKEGEVHFTPKIKEKSDK